jgi:glycosyltransferase involved in cell wall biosynthesis
VSALVSLVMPTRLVVREWLLEAVGSALDDDAATLELIVVDDGSAEPVEDVLAPVREPRLRVIRTAAAGPYAARNVGIAAAQGQWMRFVDSDDVVTSGSTSRLLEAAAGERVITYGATLVCDERLTPQRLISSTLAGDVAAACAGGRFDVRVVSMLFPRSVIAAAGEWDTRFSVSGDWDFVLRAVEQAPVRPVDLIATRYRRHASSVTRTADVAAGEHARRQIVERYLDRRGSSAGGALARDVRANLFLDSAAAYAHHDQRRLALDRLVRAAPLRPAATGAAAMRLLPRLVMPRRRGV